MSAPWTAACGCGAHWQIEANPPNNGHIPCSACGSPLLFHPPEPEQKRDTAHELDEADVDIMCTRSAVGALSTSLRQSGFDVSVIPNELLVDAMAKALLVYAKSYLMAQIGSGIRISATYDGREIPWS